jgi:hypothetical protein
VEDPVRILMLKVWMEELRKLRIPTIEGYRIKSWTDSSERTQLSNMRSTPTTQWWCTWTDCTDTTKYRRS